MFSKNNLHWTTVITEKFMLAVIGILTLLAATGEVFNMVVSRNIELGDIFLLFIYTEIIGMIGAFYASTRIPVTLPIIIAITALCRLIVLHSKEADPMNLLAEAGAILILAGAAYALSLKDKLSLEKEKIRNE
jgi:protein PsiE